MTGGRTAGPIRAEAAGRRPRDICGRAWGRITVARGPIVRLIRDRGFGFVRTEDGSEIFIHHSALPRGVFDTLAEGQELEFEIETDVRGRGQRATNVEIIR
ncbi:MAG: cold shock domain-containing protein [Chloroflexi bacterium]|nr:cold shock domain-containing protein [Chloroflexota bacterium]